MLTQRTALVALFVLMGGASASGVEPAADSHSQSPAYVLVHEHHHHHRGLLATAVTGGEHWLHAIAFDASVQDFKFEPGDVVPHSARTTGSQDFRGFSHIAASDDGRHFVCTTPRGRRAVVFRRSSKHDAYDSIALSPKTDGLSDWMPQESVFSPDGRFLYTTDRRGWIYVFAVSEDRNWKPSRRDRVADEPIAGVKSLVIHPDGLSAMALDRVNGTLTLLSRDPVVGSLTPRQMLADDVTSMRGLTGAVDMALSADGRFLYISSGDMFGDFGISVFQLTSQGKLKLVQEMFDGQERTRDLHLGEDLIISPDGTQLLLCTKHRDKILCFDRDAVSGRLTGKQVIYTATQPPLGVTGPSFGPSGHLYVVTEYGKVLLVFERRAAARVSPATGSAPPMSLGPTQRPSVPPMSSSSIPVRTVPTPTATVSPRPATPAPTATVPSPSAAPRASQIVSELDRLSGHQKGITDLVFAPDGVRAASSSDDGLLKVWDVARRAETYSVQISKHAVYAIDWSPDGKLIAVAGSEGVISLRDADMGSELRRWTADALPIYSIALSPDGKSLLSVGSGEVQLWNMADGKQIRTFSHQIGSVRGVAFSPDGITVMAYGGPFANVKPMSGPSETLRVWRVADGVVLMKLTSPQHRGVGPTTFSPDGKNVAAVGSVPRGVGIWSVQTGELLKSVPHSMMPVGGVAYLPNGRYLVIGQTDVMLADLALEETAFVLKGPTETVTSLAVSPDGRTIIGGVTDRTIRIWRTPEIAVPKPDATKP